VVAVDGRLFRATSEGLLQMLGGTELPAVVEQLNQARPLLVFDTFEELENLTPFLRDDFLPQLDFNVPIVIAGRRPMGLAWRSQWAWHQRILPLPLEAFRPADGQAYLAQRGVEEPDLVNQI